MTDTVVEHLTIRDMFIFGNKNTSVTSLCSDPSGTRQRHHRVSREPRTVAKALLGQTQTQSNETRLNTQKNNRNMDTGITNR